MKTKKTHLIIALFLSFTTVNLMAQWKVYDGSYIPNKPGIMQPEFTKGDTTADVTDGEEAVLASVVDDPDIAGNKLLKIEELDGDKRESWIVPLAPNNVAGITAVMRVKPTKAIIDLFNQGYNDTRYAYLSIRDGAYSTELQIDPAYGITLISPEMTAPIPDDGWQLYRMTVKGDEVTVYLNEDPTPIFKGNTEKTTKNLYIKFGSKSTDTRSGSLYDWLIWDESGAYAPGQGTAIPSNLSTEYGGGTSSIGSVNENNQSSLYNYPNPFKGETTISFTLEKDAKAKISLYNASGMLLKEIANRNFTAGEHTIGLNGSHLPIGVYFIVLETDGQQSFSKMFVAE